MKPLHPNLLAMRSSLTEVGEGGARADRFGGEASRWSRLASRSLVAKTVLKRRADLAVASVSQPWQRCENSAPDTSHSRNPSQRIKEVTLESKQPDRCLTGDHTAEGRASGLDTSQAAVASGDATFFPQVRGLDSERGRASRADAGRMSNLLS